MFHRNTLLTYPALLITSSAKGFEALGRKIGMRGKEVAKWVNSASKNYDLLNYLAVKILGNKKKLTLILDDTLVKKPYSQATEGCEGQYDTKLYQRVMGYKALIGMITDGTISLPLTSIFLFSKDIFPEQKESRFDYTKKIILKVINLFPQTKITVVADGAFATKEFFRWCVDNKIALETRIRSNCTVIYKGQKVAINKLKNLKPKGRQMARTIEAMWHGIPIFITAQRRIDKHHNETIVFQASTFEAKPIEHVRIYRQRWFIEQFFRTAKQLLGLQNCYSNKVETQENHVSSVLLAYALVQLHRKKKRLQTPEAAIRAVEFKNSATFIRYLDLLDHLIH